MIPLETNRRVLTWLCVFPLEESTSRGKKIAISLFFTFVWGGVNVLSFFVSFSYFFKYMDIDLEQSLFAIVQMLGEFNMTYMTLTSYLLRDKIFSVYNSLSKIYKQYEGQVSFKFLTRANQQSELNWSIIFGVLKYGILTMIISTIFSTLLGWWLEGEYVTEYSYRAYKAVLPCDQSTLIGYVGETIYDISLSTVYGFGGCFIVFFISLCQHYQAFCQMFEHSVLKLGDSDHNQEMCMCKLIRFHVTVKELFNESADAFSLFFLVQLVTAMLMLSGAVFQMDLQIQHPSFDGSITILTISVSTSILFLYCYFGKIATDSLEGFADRLYESKWHVLPVHLQKYVIIMIANAQRPLIYHGFGIVNLDLGTFTKFMKAVYTYYMMFKTITE